MLYKDSSVLQRMLPENSNTIASAGSLGTNLMFLDDKRFAPKNMLTQPFDGPLSNPMGLSGLNGIGLNNPYILNSGISGLGAFDLSTFASSFGGSASGFALIAAGLLFWQAFFGPGAKQERGKKRLAKEDARHTSQIATIKAKYGLG